MRRALAVVLLLVAVAACSGSQSSPEPSAGPRTSPDSADVSEPGKIAPAPARGACYRLSFDQLTEPTNSSRSVPCARRHSAQTIHVGKLRLVVDGHALAVDSSRVKRQVAQACPLRFASYVGGEQEDRDLSRLRVVWFSPTLAEADAGARWFRCDLVAFDTDSQLHRQQGVTPRGVLDGDDGRDRYGLCGTAAPGAEGFNRVLCERPHSWRAIATIQLDGGARYPGATAVRAAGDSDCLDQAREFQDFALTFTYGWEWPDRAQWRAGQRFGYCWAPS